MTVMDFLNNEKLIGDNNRIFLVSPVMNALLNKWRAGGIGIIEEREFIGILGMAYYAGASEAAQRYDTWRRLPQRRKRRPE